MKRSALTAAMVAALLVLLAAVAAQGAQARVRCTSGATLYVDGRLRIFALPFPPASGFAGHGYDEYACLGGRGRPLHVALDVGGGVGEVDTYRYVFAGGRYLAVASVDIGENGGDGGYDVYDLRARRRIRWASLDWDFDHDTELRLSPSGEFVTTDSTGHLVAYPVRAKRHLLSEGPATDVAVAGTTVYWTERGAARSAVVAGTASAAPDHVLGSFGVWGHSRCEARPGTTVARTPGVRVARRGRAFFACRPDSKRALALPSHIRPASLRIAGSRWLFAYDGCARSGMVLDTRSRRIVTAVPLQPDRPSALLDDGTLAWIDGGVLGQAPDTEEPVTVAPADPAPTALAHVGKTVYWTAGGAPHRWRPPAPAPRPMAGSIAGCA